MEIVNKKAYFDYRVLEKYEAGIALLGGEVKSIKQKNVNLSGSFCKIIRGEVYLVNLSIPIQGKKDYDSMRSRKVLLHKNEVINLNSKLQAKKLTLIPLKLYTNRRLIKLEIGLCKLKKEFNKKELLKLRDIERDTQRELRGDKDRT